MVDAADDCRGVERPLRGPERVFAVRIDAVSAAHLQVLADREGVTPEALAGRLVAQRLHATFGGLTEEGE